MSTKSILTVLTESDLAETTLSSAADLARGWDAHLDVLCLGVDTSRTGYDMVGAEIMMIQETLHRASAVSTELQKTAEATLAQSGLRWAVEARVTPLSEMGRAVALRARYTDLVVLPRPYGPNRGIELETALEGALFDGRCPVYVLPEGGECPAEPKQIIVAWNESAEALAAVKAALPMLVAADMVHIAVIDPPQHGPERSDPGGALAQYLARHGVRAEIDVISKTMPRVADVLMRQATDLSADMIVMGAYGHSRLREAVLGGATRDMLESATLPVVMAH